MGKKSKSSPASSARPVPAAPVPCAVPLVAWMDERVEELRGMVPRALRAWDEDAIHQARVNTRKLKAAIDLMAPVTGRETRRSFGRILRRLRRRLGPLRDLDVMIGHLKELAHADGSPHAPAAKWMGERLATRRDDLHAASSGKEVNAILAKLGTWWGMREELIAAGEAVDSLLAESVHLQLDAFAEQADRLTGVSTPAADGDGHPQDPHELRIAGKALRYTLDMAGVQGHPLPGEVAKAFKRMQEALGLWHDHVVLSETALRLCLDHLLAHHDTDRHVRVLDLAQWAARTAADHMGGFGALWTGQGADLAATIRSAFPLTRALPSDPAGVQKQKRGKKSKPTTTEPGKPCDPAAATEAPASEAPMTDRPAATSGADAG